MMAYMGSLVVSPPSIRNVLSIFLVLFFSQAFALNDTSLINEPLDNFTFYTEVYPPANYVENGESKGITVEIVKELWQQLGIDEQPIQFVPWARGYRFTLEQPNTVLFTTSRTPAREPLFKWVGPVFHSEHVMIAKKSSQLSFTSLGQTFEHDIATVLGDVSDISLTQVGFPDQRKIQVSKIEHAYNMLASDRVDMMVMTNHGFNYLARNQGINIDDFEIVWVINKTGNYLAFNRQTPDYVIAQYQQALEQIKPKLTAIKEKYLLPKNEY